MRKIALLLRTLPRLGLANILRVARYRLGLASGLHPVLRLKPLPAEEGPVFSPCPPSAAPAPVTLALMGWHEQTFGAPPDWLQSPFQADVRVTADRPWHESLAPPCDIKEIWELSRFYWTLPLARRIAAGGADGAVAEATLEAWVADWMRANPPYRGPNWGCGQEAGIRVIHLLGVLLLTGRHRAPTPAMRVLLETHLQRIAPTIGYAIAQDNNHGSSEAAALYAGGGLLAGLGVARAQGWHRLGRRWLENRARRLILPDGAGNQYSTGYHRTVLDTYAFCEAWRRAQDWPPLSAPLRGAMGRAVEWLHAVTDPETGDAVNLGANDGGHVFNIAGAAYRDFRPSVQLGAVLFRDALAYGDRGSWDEPLALLGLERPGACLPAQGSRVFAHGGLAVLRAHGATAYLRLPRDDFRPAQADPLHVDLWRGGRNLLRDAGSYSYHAPFDAFAYFSGIEGHNSVQFDDGEPMPRLGRFLFGDWLRGTGEAFDLDGPAPGAESSYTTRNGAVHHRRLVLHPGRLECTDTLSGRWYRAVLRWRLAPGAWRLEDGVLRDGAVSLDIRRDGQPMTPAPGEGWESRFYLRRTPLPVVEVAINAPATLTTTFAFDMPKETP